MRIPAAAIAQGNLMPIADGVDPAVAALTEPFACVLRGQDAVDVRPGDVVVVVGVGPIGAMHILLARLRGAGRIIASDMNCDRLAMASGFGADRVVDPDHEDLAEVVAAESQGQGADVVIVAAPAHAAQEAALRVAGLGGRINFFGGLPKDRPTIAFDSNLVHYKELRVTGTTACSTRRLLAGRGHRQLGARGSGPAGAGALSARPDRRGVRRGRRPHGVESRRGTLTGDLP